MGKFKLIAFSAMLLLSAYPENTPKDVAQKWLTHFYHMDFEGAMPYSTAETRTLLNVVASFSSSFEDSVKQKAQKTVVTIKNVREKGDTAYVTFSSPADPTANEPPLKLIRQHNKWLVLFTKSDFKPDETERE